MENTDKNKIAIELLKSNIKIIINNPKLLLLMILETAIFANHFIIGLLEKISIIKSLN